MTEPGPDSALSTSEQHAARDRLAAERAATTARIDSLTRQWQDIVESSEWTTDDDEHDPEGATIAFERARTRGLLDRAHEELNALDRAGERLRSGTYDRCERCGRTIAEQRLVALPATTTCIDCANSTRR